MLKVAVGTAVSPSPSRRILRMNWDMHRRGSAGVVTALRRRALAPGALDGGPVRSSAHGLDGRETLGSPGRDRIGDRGCRLSDLPLAEYQAAHPGLDERVFDALGVERAIQAFVSYGSTGPACVGQQIADWKARLAQ